VVVSYVDSWDLAHDNLETGATNQHRRSPDTLRRLKNDSCKSLASEQDSSH
jgi:hypothetical protein